MLTQNIYAAASSIMPPRERECVTEQLGCDETGFDWKTLECVYTCYATHWCGDGPSYSYTFEARANCSHRVASIEPGQEYLSFSKEDQENDLKELLMRLEKELNIQR